MADINLTETYIDHEVRIRMQELINQKLNRKLIIPIVLHALDLI